MNTKRDVLQALYDAVSNYGPHVVNLYSITLWDALKFEVLHMQEEDLAELSLKVLAEIAVQLSKEPGKALDGYLKPITKECNEHLEDAPTKQSQAAGRILQSVASASSRSCDFLVSAVVPNLLALYQASNVFAKRRGLVECLCQLLRADLAVYGDWRVTPTSEVADPASNAFLKFSAEVFDMLRNALAAVPIKEVSFRLTLLDGALQLLKIRGLLSDDDISKAILSFTSVVVEEESYGKDDMKEAAMNGMVEISHQKPQLVVNSAFPAFLGQLPDKDNDGPETYLPTLEAFAKLGGEPRVFETVILRLKNKFNSAVREGASNVYLQAILSALLYAFSKNSKENESHVDYLAHFRNLVIPLLRQICTKLDASQQDDTIFYLSGRLANTVLRQLPRDTQKDFMGQIYTLFLEHPQSEAPPFNLQATTEDGRRIIVSTYMLGAIDRNLSLPFEIRDIVSCCSQFALKEGYTFGTRIATLQQISLVLNKFVSAADIQTVLDPVLHSPMNLLQAENLSSISIQVVFAMFKGLMLRNSTAISEIYPQLLSALSDSTNGRNIAHGFSTLLQPDEVLTKANYCIVSTLHKQKIFSILVPPLSNGFRQADAASKPNYLIALSGILRWIPYNVLEPQLQSLNPLLLQTLDVQGEDAVKAGTIDTLISILNSNPKAIEEHCGSLISRLVNASAGNSNPPNVRVKALQCLSLVAVQQRTEIVVPFRKSVIKKLVAALDAGRRSVRAEAVRCRSKWLELDEAGDDEE
jgi:DNA repair/transcription protein MET18/MMS19